ncbi:MAG TPA: hypothetical protein VI076_12215 [Actinopolymorphaceae bacterium]
MKRLFWVVLGVTVGALVVKKLSDKAQQLTPQGIAEQAQRRVGSLGNSLRGFVEDVREGIAQRERELQEALLQSGDHPTSGYGIDPEAATRFAHDPDARWDGHAEERPGSRRDNGPSTDGER